MRGALGKAGVVAELEIILGAPAFMNVAGFLKVNQSVPFIHLVCPPKKNDPSWQALILEKIFFFFVSFCV